MKLPVGFAGAAVALGLIGFVLSRDFGVTSAIAGALILGFSATGALVAARLPRNRIGWLFLGIGMAAALALLAPGLADRGLDRPGSSGTATEVFAAYASASWVPMMVPGLTLLLLWFPDGRVPGRRWRWVERIAGVGIVLAFVAVLVAPGPLEDYPQIRNPLGIAAAESLEGPSSILLLIALISCPVSLFVRYRRADGVTRQQIRWLAFAGAVAAGAFVAGFVGFGVAAPEVAVHTVMMGAVLAIPIAAAVAILRYRLYDIDVVINRALVYTALTVTLVAVYLVTVLVAQLALPERNELGVAASTLVVAAAFAPARTRIQAVVDRRFFRRRYDAEQTLHVFGARLRDEVDLRRLSEDLRGVIAETVQPVHVSIWLRQ